jgi:hypothetical protein
MAATKVFDSAEQVKPYVQRALQDEEVRAHLLSALGAARAAASKFSDKSDRGYVAAATRVAVEPEILSNLRKATSELRSAVDRVQRPAESKSHSGRNFFLLVLGVVLGILYNPVTGPETRKWVSDSLFGGGDDFTYQATSEANGTN